MASAVTEAHIVAQARLRAIVERAVTGAWDGLGGYDEDDVAAFTLAATPVVLAAMRQSVVLTDAYLARILGRRPLGIDPVPVIAAIREGVDPREQWRRPFVTVWTALGNGTAYEQAVRNGLLRSIDMATTDVQLAHRGALQAAQERDAAIRGYRRVADGGACSFCRTVNGAFVKSASAAPLHPGCGCGFEPELVDRPVTPLPEDVAVHEHGELGPTLGSPAHDFTSL